MASLTQWTWVWINSRSWWWTRRPGACCSSWGCKESDMIEWLNWTESQVKITTHTHIHTHTHTHFDESSISCPTCAEHFLKESESEVAQSCLTLSDSMDYSLPGSSVHGIFQARVLEWVAISFSTSSSYLDLN